MTGIQVNQIALEVLDSLWQKHKKKFISKKTESYVQFARRIILPDGKGKGTFYRPETHQAQLAILQEMDRGEWKEVTIVKPVQDGGTLVSLVPLFRRAVEQAQTVVLAYPTNDSARDIWSTKVAPIMYAFGGIEPQTGPGSSGGAARVIKLPTGGQFLLRGAGGRGESGQASVTGDCVQVDEAEDWPSLHRIKLIGLRVEEAPDPLKINICTVKRQIDSIILALYAAGTKSRLYYACAHCGQYQLIEWKNVTYEVIGYKAVPGSERITCIHCAAMNNEQERRIMLANWKLVHEGQTIDIKTGHVTGPILSSKCFSIMWTRLESPRKSLLSTCETYQESKMYLDTLGDHGPMKSFFQDYLCQPYTGDLEELEAGGLLNFNQLLMRANLNTEWISRHITDRDRTDGIEVVTYTRHVADPPQDAEAVICAIDVQDNRIYWVMTAVFLNGSTADFAWGIEYAWPDHRPASDIELFELLNRARRVILGYTKDVPFALGGVDNGHRPDIVQSWVAKFKENWRNVRGDGGKKKAEFTDIEGLAYNRDGVIYINVENSRELYHAAIRRKTGEPGSVIFPGGLTHNDATYFRHICARQSSIDPKTKKKIEALGSGREDFLDCRNYITVLVIGYLETLRQIKHEKVVEEMHREVSLRPTSPPGEEPKPEEQIPKQPQQQVTRVTPVWQQKQLARPVHQNMGGRRSYIGQNRRSRRGF